MTEITKIDESKLDIEKEVGDKEKVKVNLKKEIAFARDLHPKGCVGLNVDQQPPDPDVWFGLVDGNNFSQKLVDNWEQMKTLIIQEIQQKDHPDPNKQKTCCDFLETTTSIYMDLMCSIWVNFKDEILEYHGLGEEMSVDSVPKEKEEA